MTSGTLILLLLNGIGIPIPLSPTAKTSPPGINLLTSIYKGTSLSLPEAKGVLITVLGIKGKPKSLFFMFSRIITLSAASSPISFLNLP